jgi:hypothetical protein
MASTELSKTFSASNRKTWTFSAWIKFSSFGGVGLFAAYADSSNRSYFGINGSHQLLLYAQQSGSDTCSVYSTQVFRDPSAWYHIMCVCDTTQSTSTDRVKFYVNGSQADVTFSHTPDQNEDLYLNGGYEHAVGSRDGSSYFDGLMSHVHFADGTAYTPSTFGSTDTNGQWKINTSPTVTYGTNGFFILKDGNSVTDQSGNSNNFTVGAGTLTNTEDCPSNVYCVFNPLIPQGLAYANGNLSATHNASSWKTAYGTIAMSGTGKYYFESKVSTLGSYQGVGIVDAEQISASASKFGAVSRGYGYKNDGSKTNNNSDASYGATYTTGDIIGCALDLTNGAIYFSKNGAWQNSATTGEIAAGTTTNAAYTSISSSYVYLPAVQIYGSGTNQFNAGNGIFGTTAVSSVQNPSSGDTSAKFEYTPPTGFQPITTKGLNA